MTANTPPLLRLPVLSGIAAAVMFILPTGDTPNGGANLTTVPLDKLHLRESSPPMPSSRIDDFALLESSWAVFLSGFSNGRIAENDNQGTTFEAQFTAETTLSSGDVVIAPSHGNRE